MSSINLDVVSVENIPQYSPKQATRNMTFHFQAYMHSCTYYKEKQNEQNLQG